jgi:hypothetical protein
MPTVGAVLKNVTKEVEIQEPTYKDVVVLYRRTVPDKPVKKSDRDPVIACDKVKPQDIQGRGGTVPQNCTGQTGQEER